MTEIGESRKESRRILDQISSIQIYAAARNIMRNEGAVSLDRLVQVLKAPVGLIARLSRGGRKYEHLRQAYMQAKKGEPFTEGPGQTPRVAGRLPTHSHPLVYRPPHTLVVRLQSIFDRIEALESGLRDIARIAEEKGFGEVRNGIAVDTSALLRSAQSLNADWSPSDTNTERILERRVRLLERRIALVQSVFDQLTSTLNE